MSQVLTLVALGALVIALILLFLYYRQESKETGTPVRPPLPGRYFITILVTATLLGMAVTEWQGVCSLSPWGFAAGVVLGLAAEVIAWRYSRPGGS